MAIRVLLADDHKMMREGLKTVLGRAPDLDVAGEAADGASAVKLASEIAVDVVVMDVTMPGLNGIDAARQITETLPDVRVVMLSMHADRRFVTEALRAGAKGYVLKDFAVDELVAAIRSVARGGTFLSAPVADVVVRDYVQRMQEPAGSGGPTLSARERQVLQLLAEGASTKEIAARLRISAKTVDTHRRQIMDRLNLHSIAELTKYAIREGLTDL